jgi:hypothetical protein
LPNLSFHNAHGGVQILLRAVSCTGSDKLPSVVQVSLTQQPALFDRAFQRLFAKEIAAATHSAIAGSAATAAAKPLEASNGVGADPAASLLLERFWRRKLPEARPLLAGSTGAEGPAAPAARAGEQQASRYLTDFQVKALTITADTLSAKAAFALASTSLQVFGMKEVVMLPSICLCL